MDEAVSVSQNEADFPPLLKVANKKENTQSPSHTYIQNDTHIDTSDPFT